MKQIAIVGAGVSGLICALELERFGYSPVIFESSSQIGGRVATERVPTSKGEVLVDRGFQVLLAAYPEVERYLHLPSLNLQKLDAAASVHLSNGKLKTIGDPLASLKWFWPSLSNSFSSLSDLWLMFRLQRHASRMTEEAIFTVPEQSTISFLIDWGFSEKLIRNFFQPFYAGIFLEAELTTSVRMFLFVFKMFARGSASIPTQGMEQIALHLSHQLERTTINLNKTIESEEALKTYDACVLPHSWTGRGPREWHECSNFIFEVECEVQPLNHLFLVPKSAGCAVNNYHYSAHTTSERTVYLLNATSLNPHNPSEIRRELEEMTGLSNLQLRGHFHIPQALPADAPMCAAPSISDLKGANGTYYLGDGMLYPSLNAAMKSGRLVASRIHTDFQALRNEDN